MSLVPGEEIGGEIHADTDQFFRIEEGKGLIVIDGVIHKIISGDCAVVPAGAHHNLICAGRDALKIYTIYGPSHHRDQLIQKTNAEANAGDEGFEGLPTEPSPPIVQI
jgi:mannose-6-phosphate isomerase-like protein (cupin superfamily)